MEKLVKIFLIILSFGLFVGRNIPYNNMLYFGLGVWDFIVIISLTPIILKHSFRDKTIIVSISGLFISLLIGTTLNSFNSILLNDFLEILRLLYSITLVGLGIYMRKYINPKMLANILFSVSVFIFILAYINPMNPDVLGFVQIWNPNVIGQSILHNAIIIYILNYKDRNPIRLLQVIILAGFAIFTYSKASWILAIAILITVFYGLKGSMKLIIVAFFTIYIFNNSKLLEPIYTLGKSKIEATEFDKSAAEGGSVGARFGLALSATKMFLKRPIFGVGIGNFEIENKRMQFELKENFYEDDNANSLIFHYLAVGGLFSIFFIFSILIIYYVRLTNFVSSKRIKILSLIFLIVATNFQRELITANTMWLILGYFYENNSTN